VIRVSLPAHLKVLARVGDDVLLDIPSPVTLGAILDALEQRHPMLRGTVRDRLTARRRDFIRFFACEEDLSLVPLDTPVPEAVADGREPLLIVGAIAGG
jgi:hypothetical protein